MGKFIRVGLISCPKNHTALGHLFYNQLDITDDEGEGSKIKVQCGLCGLKFEGKVEKVSERYETNNN